MILSNKEKQDIIERRIEILNFEISDLLNQLVDLDNFLPRTPEEILLVDKCINDKKIFIEALSIKKNSLENQG
jgi:hypothetical protein